MSDIRAFQAQDLPQLTQIINTHISMLIPTWGLPSSLILSHLEKNPEQDVIDPWVIERKTFCAFVGEKLVAAAHLLRYGNSETVNENHHKHGDIAWLVFDPEYEAEAKALLATCHAQMKRWRVKSLGAWESGLSIPCFTGISDNWPHIAKLFYEAGYRPKPERAEAVFGGGFETVLAQAKQELKWIVESKRVEKREQYTVFTNQGYSKIAFCQFDIFVGTNKPNLEGWAELSEIWVDEAWHRQGIGRFLVQLMVSYQLIPRGIRNIVFSVAKEDEEAGAGAFYQSFGWKPFSRSQDGWMYEGKL